MFFTILFQTKSSYAMILRDSLWINDEIKKMIMRKYWLFQSQRKSCNLDFAILNLLTQDISDAITSPKLKYHERLANKLKLRS